MGCSRVLRFCGLERLPLNALVRVSILQFKSLRTWDLLVSLFPNLFGFGSRAPALARLPGAIVISRILLIHRIRLIILASQNSLVLHTFCLPLVKTILLAYFHGVDGIERNFLDALICNDIAKLVHVHIIQATLVHGLIIQFRLLHPPRLVRLKILARFWICNPAWLSSFGRWVAFEISLWGALGDELDFVIALCVAKFLHWHFQILNEQKLNN